MPGIPPPRRRVAGGTRMGSEDCCVTRRRKVPSVGLKYRSPAGRRPRHTPRRAEPPGSCAGLPDRLSLSLSLSPVSFRFHQSSPNCTASGHGVMQPSAEPTVLTVLVAAALLGGGHAEARCCSGYMNAFGHLEKLLPRNYLFRVPASSNEDKVLDNFQQVRRSLLCFLREELNASRLSCEELNISEALQRVLEMLECPLENCTAEMEQANCTRQDLRVFFEVHQFKEKYRSACNGTEDRSDSFPMERCRGVYPAANGAPSSSEPLPTTCTCPTTTTDSAPTASDSAPITSDSAPTASDSASTACNSTPTASSRTPTASDSIQNSSSIREKSWSPACRSETVLLLTSVLLNVFLVVTVIYLLSRRRHPVSHETTQPEETPLQNSTL